MPAPYTAECQIAGVPRRAARVLIRRFGGNIDTASRFVFPRCDLPPASAIPGMREATDLLVEWVSTQKPIVIYSDFDADGITGAAIAEEGLRLAGARNLSVYFPSRMVEGYGFHEEAVLRLASQPSTLFVTVDCGITGAKACEAARTVEARVVVTDHHVPGPSVPAADCVLDPLLPEWRDLNLEMVTGAGVAYLLVRSLLRQLGIELPGGEDWALDLLTISIAGDGQPVTGINRFWVTRGLELLRRPSRPGLAKLIALFRDLEGGEVQGDLDYERDLMFGIVPRINAAGRLGDPRLAWELLRETDQERASSIAQDLEQLNRERKRIEDAIVSEAAETIRSSLFPENYSVFAYGPLWHEGVVGIAASKIRDAFGKPAVLLAGEGDVVKGSVRGIPGFNVHTALSRCADLLVSWGGHAGAGGLSLRRENVQEFFTKFNHVTRELMQKVPFVTAVFIDDEIPIEEVRDDYFEELLGLAPFDRSYPVPVVASRDVPVSKVYLAGNGQKHLSLLLGASQMRFMMFGGAQAAWDVSSWGMVDVMFQPSKYRWQGKEYISGHVKGIRPSLNLRSAMYRHAAEKIKGLKHAVVYTWSEDAAAGMVAALWLQGVESRLHLEGLRGSLMHDCLIALDHGDVVVSTAPWELPLGNSREYTLAILHPPETPEKLRLIADMIERPNVTLVLDFYSIDDSIRLLSALCPGKEYMERAWKFIRTVAGKDKLNLRDVVLRWEDFVRAVDKERLVSYEDALVLLESCLEILDELELTRRDLSTKEPIIGLSPPNGRVSLSNSPAYVRFRNFAEAATEFWSGTAVSQLEG